jgi:sugar lactone lactonase YvrE
VDSSGNFFLTDDTTVRKATLVGTNYIVSMLAGLARSIGGTDGTNSMARFNTPSGIAIDAATNLYVADFGNNTIRKISPSGTNWVVTTLAGVAGVTGSADGVGTNALFNNPFGLSLDSGGNLFVADSGNNTIREISPQGTNWIVTTVAGSSSHSGSTDGTNTVARFNTPRDIAVDTNGILYVTDRNNGTVRKTISVGTNWIVTTIAGQAGQKATVDGTNSTAHFSAPDGIAVDTVGNLYVSDTADDVIRQLMPIGTNWVVTTIGGIAGINGSTDGAGGSALFNYPDNIKVDNSGRLYIADRDNYIIRQGIVGSNYIGAPIILTQPQRATVFVGSNAEFFVTAIGGQLNYQWRFNDVDISGATNNVYGLINVSTNSAGNYSVAITTLMVSPTARKRCCSSRRHCLRCSTCPEPAKTLRLFFSQICRFSKARTLWLHSERLPGFFGSTTILLFTTANTGVCGVTAQQLRTKPRNMCVMPRAMTV